MIKRLYNRILFRIRRIYVSQNNKRFQKIKSVLSTEQLQIGEICKLLILDPDSDLLIAPVSGAYYIKNGELFCKIDYGRILLINGKYSYDITINPDFILGIRNLFCQNLEARRRKMELQMLQNIRKSLGTIYTDLKTKNDI